MTVSLPIASNQEPDADHDLLGLWIRERGFGRSLDRWWLAPVNHSGKFTPKSYYSDPGEVTVSAFGREIIEVLNVADGLATYRHYVMNPVGVRLSWSAVPQIDAVEKKTAYKLRQTLKRLKMNREGEVAAQVEERRPGPATVIPFPQSRIIRRIYHGRGVVVRQWPNEAEVAELTESAGVVVAFPGRPA
jgi:hypothetical protein